MSKIPLLKNIFFAHTTDLADVMYDLDGKLLPKVENRVLCPICLVGYPEEAITDKTLTDGHIWPKAIRQGSKKAPHYRVLLCAECNHSSGSRGDSQMQMIKQSQDEELSGQYRNRSVHIAFGPDVRPISLKASEITIKAGDSPVNAKIRIEPTRNDPKEMVRFRELYPDKSFSLIIPLHEEIKPKVAKVGWLTAAYLMTFRAFGYRYILHSRLNPVRQCIQDSFTNDEPVFPESDVLQIRQCNIHNNENPTVSVIVTTNGKLLVFVQVDFLNFHIRLPFHFRPDVLSDLIPDDFILPIGEGDSLGIGVQCTKLVPHQCVWDFVMGKPKGRLSSE